MGGGRGQSHFAGAPYVFLQLFEANRVKFYMMNEVSEMVGHHGQVLREREPREFFKDPFHLRKRQLQNVSLSSSHS